VTAGPRNVLARAGFPRSFCLTEEP